MRSSRESYTIFCMAVSHPAEQPESIDASVGLDLCGKPSLRVLTHLGQALSPQNPNPNTLFPWLDKLIQQPSLAVELPQQPF